MFLFYFFVPLIHCEPWLWRRNSVPLLWTWGFLHLCVDKATWEKHKNTSLACCVLLRTAWSFVSTHITSRVSFPFVIALFRSCGHTLTPSPSSSSCLSHFFATRHLQRPAPSTMAAATGRARTRPPGCAAAARWVSRCSPTAKPAKVSERTQRVSAPGVWFCWALLYLCCLFIFYKCLDITLLWTKGLMGILQFQFHHQYCCLIWILIDPKGFCLHLGHAVLIK